MKPHSRFSEARRPATALALWLLLLGGVPRTAFAIPAAICANVLAELAQPGRTLETSGNVARWLHHQNPRLHLSQGVTAVANALGLSKPAEKISAWSEYLKLALELEKPRGELRGDFLDSHTIKAEEIPESFFQRQRQIARENGHGDVPISPELRKTLSETVISDQRESLGRWFDYLSSPDTSHYPTWAKAYVLTEVAKLSKFDPERGRFPKRDKAQVAPYPELNREALAQTIAAVQAQAVSGERATFSFAETYAQQLHRTSASKADLTITGGRWVKYDKGSSPKELVDSLSGCNTGWCTAETATAAQHLANGDFHVFYSFDHAGKASVPRLAIRMWGGSITEVRGTGKDQHLDPHIAGTNVLSEKLKTFGREGELYQKRSEDMRVLGAIERKHRNGQPLTQAELRLLYELDGPIKSFGYGDDPRPKQIRSERSLKKDLAVIFADGLTEADISLTREEALRGSRFHYGDLDLRDVTTPQGLKLPRTVYGNVKLDGLKNAEGLKLPDTVQGNLELNGLITATGLNLPATVRGDLGLFGLTTAHNLKLTGRVYGILGLHGLKTAEGLELPDISYGSLSLHGLRSAKGLKLPKTVHGDLILFGLKSAHDLTIPDTVYGGISLGGLESAEGLKLPEVIHDGLDLGRLKTARGLKLPATMRGTLSLNGLKTAEGLRLPSAIDGDLYLTGLLTPEGLHLPERISGNVQLYGLKTAQGLQLPKLLGGKYVGPPIPKE